MELIEFNKIIADLEEIFPRIKLAEDDFQELVNFDLYFLNPLVGSTERFGTLLHELKNAMLTAALEQLQVRYGKRMTLKKDVFWQAIKDDFDVLKIEEMFKSM